jgi:hypothetical protein
MRRAAMPAILQDDLSEWREVLRRSGHPARDIDFVIPGDLASARHGVRDPGQAPATSVKTRRTLGVESSSPPPSRRSPSNPSSSPSSVRHPTRCGAAASPSACAPRTRRPWRASAARAYRCSAPTTRSRSRTCANTDHGQLTSIGARHERREWTPRPRKNTNSPTLTQARMAEGVDANPSLLGSRLTGEPCASGQASGPATSTGLIPPSGVHPLTLPRRPMHASRVGPRTCLLLANTRSLSSLHRESCLPSSSQRISLRQIGPIMIAS